MRGALVALQALPEEVVKQTLSKYTQIFTILTGNAPVL